MICDTSFLIDLMKNQPRAVAKANQIAANKTLLSITSVVLYELLKGLRDASEVRRTRVESVVSGMKMLPFDAEAAKEAAKIENDLARRGIPIEPEDCLTAGIAKIHNETILTRNVKHFSRIEGLRVETY